MEGWAWIWAVREAPGSSLGLRLQGQREDGLWAPSLPRSHHTNGFSRAWRAGRGSSRSGLGRGPEERPPCRARLSGYSRHPGAELLTGFWGAGVWGQGGLESGGERTGHESPFLGKTEPVCDGVARVAVPGWGHMDTTLTGEAAAGPRPQTASGSLEVQPRDLPASGDQRTAPAATRSPSVGFNQLGTSLKFKTRATAPLSSLVVYPAF